MSVRFFCPSCGQPVEVDAEAAGHRFKCPFCAQLGLVPLISDARVSIDAPQAAHAPRNPIQPPPIPEAALPKKATLGIVSLIVVILSTLVAGVNAVTTVVVIGANLPPHLESRPGDDKELQEYISHELFSRSWIIVLGFLGACIGPTLGATLAIASLARGERPRWPGIVSLSVLGFCLLLTCSGLILSVMAAGASATS